MKNLFILATLLLTFGFTNAQSKIYSTDNSGYSARQVGKYEGGQATGAAASFILVL